MTSPKPPTPQGISRLLKSAGFTKGVIKMRGGCSGFAVEADHFRPGAVRVRHKFWAMGYRTPEQYREWQDRYAKTITGAGWSVKAEEYELIVTAKKG